MFRCSLFYELGMQCDTVEEKAELWQSIMEYWLYWKEPPQKFKLLFVNIKFILGRSKEISEKRSEAWKNHTGNQYTKWDEKRNSSDKAQKKTVEQMEQMEQVGTNGTNIYTHTISSSSKKEEKKKRKEEMLEAFRKDDRLTPYMSEEDVCKWWDYKEWTKKSYKDVGTFIKMLVMVKNVIAKYWWIPKSDRNRRNRFSFMVMTAIDKQREWLDWYDYMEPKYQAAKDDLYPNQKQNE